MVRHLPPSPSALAESAQARLEALLSRAQAALEPAGDADDEQGSLDARRLEQKAVGLRLVEELRTLAARTGAGLALHTDAVLVTAKVLEAAGELLKAASLLSDAGLAHLAAKLAEKAGELEILQENLARIHAPDEQRHTASLAFSTYEAAMARGHLTEALDAWNRAIAARPDNPAYPELQRRLLATRPSDGRLTLQGEGVTWCLALMPAWLGRGEDAALRLQAMGISRRHARLERVGDLVRMIGARGETLWQAARDAVGALTTIALGPLELRVGTRGAGVLLQVEDGNTHAVFMMDDGSVPLDELGLAGVTLRMRWPREGFPRVAIEGAPFSVDGAPALSGGRDLAVGQTVVIGNVRLKVV